MPVNSVQLLAGEPTRMPAELARETPGRARGGGVRAAGQRPGTAARSARAWGRRGEGRRRADGPAPETSARRGARGRGRRHRSGEPRVPDALLGDPVGRVALGARADAVPTARAPALGVLAGAPPCPGGATPPVVIPPV